MRLIGRREGGKRKETRRWDDVKGKTIQMRSKEEAEDYRFIIDPDLIPFNLEENYVKAIKERIPEMPEVKLEKLIKKHKIDEKSASILARNIDIIEFFERVIEKINKELAVPWVSVELLRVLNYRKKKLDEAEIKAEHFIELLKLIKEGKITPLKGKEILNSWSAGSSMPEIKGMDKITNDKELEKVIIKIVENNKKAAEDYKNGEKKALDFLMGQIMRETSKRADYAVSRKILEKMLR